MSDADTIELRGLSTTAIVGVLPEERERPQPLEIDLDLHVDLRSAALTDALEDTVDYGAVCDTVVAVVGRARPRLLERLADLLAEEVLDLDSRIVAVDVSVRKLRPPVPHQLTSSGVRVHRDRS